MTNGRRLMLGSSRLRTRVFPTGIGISGPLAADGQWLAAGRFEQAAPALLPDHERNVESARSQWPTASG